RRDVKDRLAQVSSLIAPPAQDHQRPEKIVPQLEANIREATNTENQSSIFVRPKLDHYSELPTPRARAKTQAQSALAAITEQVINVTIGRIEVRATPPPSAAARSSNQKPPVMSLDDYLRQRSGGGRGGGV